MRKITIVQISDTHLGKDKNFELNGANPYLSLEKVIANLNSLKIEPDLLVLSGDISQDSSNESYVLVKKLLDRLKVKYYIFPGNHDDVNVINDVFELNWMDESVDFNLKLDSWLLCFLNSSRYPKEAGELSDKQFVELDNWLSKKRNDNIVVFLHHHPININSKWIDDMMLENANRFNEIVSKYKNVKAVFFGHIHQVFEKVENGILYASAPSTVYQVVPKADNFKVQKQMSGYRIISLGNDHLESNVVWVE